jgi:phosphatidylcholine synthase
MLKLQRRSKEPRRQRLLERPTEARAPTGFEQFLGWSVHAYTALGLIFAAAIAALLVRGGPESFRMCFILMVLATIVDATDGTLARKVRIKQVVPGFDGRRLDDIIDFLTYTFLPLLLIWRADILPQSQAGWLILPLVASAYGFCQVEAKTEDGYFLGFPSLWNVVAFYLYVLRLAPWAALGVVIVLALLTFVPSKYLYPSQPGKLNQFATLLGVAWTIPFALLIWKLPTTPNALDDPGLVRMTLLSLFYPVFYIGASWFVTLKQWLKRSPN